jgi:RimJ/RimL family protein N-acetyltransferase
MINLHYTQTKKYYASWLDVPLEHLDKKGIFLIETEKRKIYPKGHPKNLEMYCVAFDDSIFISYSKELNEKVNLRNCFDDIVDKNIAIDKLTALFGEQLKHRKAHYFTSLPENIDFSKVVVMKKENYEDYLQFFLKQNPKASPEGWLYEYFIKIVENKRCFGVYEEDILVCATGAPDIPFLEGIITEPGIDTLKDYRNKGYALAACAKYIEVALNKNETPIWTCWHSNIASIKLAEKLGYKWFCDLFTVEGINPYN